jgi:hypothetical protein
MSKQKEESKRTSRRQFAKTAVTAAVGASMIACQRNGKDQRAAADKTDHSRCPATITQGNGYIATTCDAEITPEDHIPPMGLEGGGSLIIDSKNKFDVSGTGTGPYTYVESGPPIPHNRYGQVSGGTVIAETDTGEFFTKVDYTFVPPGAHLLMWYQDINPRNPSGSDEVDYLPLPNPLPDPDIRIQGGKTGDLFKITVKRKALQADKSHKKNRPTRWRHTGGGGMANHFRIGLWRFVDPSNHDATIVEGSGDENYNIYLKFEHFK